MARTKKLIALILTVVMIIGMIPLISMTILAEESVEVTTNTRNIFIPQTNFGQIASASGGLGSGILRSGVQNRSPLGGFVNDPLSYWADGGTANTVASGRALYMRLELPEDIDRDSITKFELEFTIHTRHNNSTRTHTLFTMKEELPTPVNSLWVNTGGAAATTAKARYSYSGVAAISPIIPSGVQPGTKVTFDLTDFAHDNPDLDVFEFTMLASSDMLDFHDATVANVSFRPNFTITYSDADPVDTLDIPEVVRHGYRLPQRAKGHDIVWSSSIPAALNDKILSDARTGAIEVALLADFGDPAKGVLPSSRTIKLTATADGKSKIFDVTVNPYDNFPGSLDNLLEVGVEANANIFSDKGYNIQAHGGHVQWLEKYEMWFWYGEEKTRHARPVDGVKLYVSIDMYNWTDMGRVMPAHDMLPVRHNTTDPRGWSRNYEGIQQLKDWSLMTAPTDEVSQANIDMAKLFMAAYRKDDGTYYEEELILAYDYNYSGYCIIERPKMLYNAKNDNYVIVWHVDGPTDANIRRLFEPSGNLTWGPDIFMCSGTAPSRYSRAMMGFAVSESPFGPFRVVNATNMNWVLGWRTGAGQTRGMARDMSVFLDEGNDSFGKGFPDAYAIYSSEENAHTYISLLNEDYTGPSGIADQQFIILDDHPDRDPAFHGKEIRTFIGRAFNPTTSRESPAPFKYGDFYYMVTSGTTGWNPNPAQYHRAPSMFGPWSNLGNPCTGTAQDTTFRTQPTAVIPVDPANGKFIYMGDRWMVHFLTGSAASFSGHVWLPVQMRDDGTIRIQPRSDWTLEDLDEFALPALSFDSSGMPNTIIMSDAPSLPTTVKVKVGGVEIETPVVWNPVATIGLTSVTGRMPEVNNRQISFTANVVPLTTPVALYTNERPSTEVFPEIALISGYIPGEGFFTGEEATVVWDLPNLSGREYRSAPVYGTATHLRTGLQFRVGTSVYAIPRGITYYVVSGTGTGYMNALTAAPVGSWQYDMVASRADLLNEISDRPSGNVANNAAARPGSWGWTQRNMTGSGEARGFLQRSGTFTYEADKFAGFLYSGNTATAANAFYYRFPVTEPGRYFFAIGMSQSWSARNVRVTADFEGASGVNLPNRVLVASVSSGTLANPTFAMGANYYIDVPEAGDIILNIGRPTSGASDGAVVAWIGVHRQLCSDSSLSSVTFIANDTIVDPIPAFDPQVLSYGLSVDRSIESIDFGFTVSSEKAFGAIATDAFGNDLDGSLDLAVGVNTLYIKVISEDLSETVYTFNITRPAGFTGTSPNQLLPLLAQGDVTVATPGSGGYGIAGGVTLVVPAGRTLYVETILNVRRDATLIIEGTVVVLEGGRLNSDGHLSAGTGTIIIAEGGKLVNYGYVEIAQRSELTNNGTITNNGTAGNLGRFEVRTGVIFTRGLVDGTRALTIHREAIIK